MEEEGGLECQEARTQEVVNGKGVYIKGDRRRRQDKEKEKRRQDKEAEKRRRRKGGRIRRRRKGGRIRREGDKEVGQVERGAIVLG